MKKKLLIAVGIIVIIIIILLVIFLRSSEENTVENTEETTAVGKVTLLCVDQYDEGIQGVKYNLTRTDGTDIGDVSTGKDGIITYYNVPVGDYVLTVLEMPEGYEITEESINLTVEELQETEITTVNNWIYSSVLVSVYDGNTGSPEADKTINIYDSATDELIASGVTNEEGQVLIKLDFGEYYLQQENEEGLETVDDEQHAFILTEGLDQVKKTIVNE